MHRVCGSLGKSQNFANFSILLFQHHQPSAFACFWCVSFYGLYGLYLYFTLPTTCVSCVFSLSRCFYNRVKKKKILGLKPGVCSGKLKIHMWMWILPPNDHTIGWCGSPGWETRKKIIGNPIGKEDGIRTLKWPLRIYVWIKLRLSP